jgi:3,4-dihydroxy 2-butanone 4-phosphate synthase/GTP cyclohydrolase II
VRSIQLITNNPAKIEHLEELGVRVTQRVPLEPTIYDDNAAYLFTKMVRMDHLYQLGLSPIGVMAASHADH